MQETVVDPEVVVMKRSRVGEGAIWDVNKSLLYWVDILSGEVCIYNPITGENRIIQTCQAVGTVVPRASGGLLVALHNGIASLDLETEKLTLLADPEWDIPSNRFNDGKCDPAGRFWAGTMEFSGEIGKGALYCFDTDGVVTKKVSPVSISNGIIWSCDHSTMYYIDTLLDNVRAWDFDVETGEISNERVVIENQGSGHFDGMSIDEEDMLWIAMAGGWAVRRFDPGSGRQLESLKLPVSIVTSCAFGGENLDELYITSIGDGFSDQQWKEEPLAGSLLRIKAPVRGVPSFSYEG